MGQQATCCGEQDHSNINVTRLDSDQRKGKRLPSLLQSKPKRSLGLSAYLEHNYANKCTQIAPRFPTNSQLFYGKGPQNYEYLLQYLKAKLVKFTDDCFTHVPDHDMTCTRLFDQHSAGHVIGQPLDCQVSMQPHPNAQIGMGYFACVIRAVARKKPELVSQIFLTKNNPLGLHILKIPANGIDRQIPIDDYLLHKSGHLLLTTPKKQLWPALLQKAWVKLHGGFTHATGKSPEYPLQQLFGLQTSVIELHKEQDILRLSKLDKEAVFLIAKEKEKWKTHIGGLASHQVFILHAIMQGNYCLQSPMILEIKSDHFMPMSLQQLKQFRVPYQRAEFCVFSKEKLLDIFDTAVVGHLSKTQTRPFKAVEMAGKIAYGKLTVENDCKIASHYLCNYKGYEQSLQHSPLIVVDIVKDQQLMDKLHPPISGTRWTSIFLTSNLLEYEHGEGLVLIKNFSIA